VELWFNLACAMSDCYYTYENQNERMAVGKEVGKCFPTAASSASTFVRFQKLPPDGAAANDRSGDVSAGQGMGEWSVAHRWIALAQCRRCLVEKERRYET
jgi:hypothetical protein